MHVLLLAAIAFASYNYDHYRFTGVVPDSGYLNSGLYLLRVL